MAEIGRIQTESVKDLENRNVDIQRLQSLAFCFINCLIDHFSLFVIVCYLER